jgi:hypothetical protein
MTVPGRRLLRRHLRGHSVVVRNWNLIERSRQPNACFYVTYWRRAVLKVDLVHVCHLSILPSYQNASGGRHWDTVFKQSHKR